MCVIVCGCVGFCASVYLCLCVAACTCPNHVYIMSLMLFFYAPLFVYDVMVFLLMFRLVFPLFKIDSHLRNVFLLQLTPKLQIKLQINSKF